MKKKTPLLKSNKTDGRLADYFDPDDCYYKSKTDGLLYIGSKNQKENTVTIIAKLSRDGARHETITMLKQPKNYAI